MRKRDKKKVIEKIKNELSFQILIDDFPICWITEHKAIKFFHKNKQYIGCKLWIDYHNKKNLVGIVPVEFWYKYNKDETFRFRLVSQMNEYLILVMNRSAYDNYYETKENGITSI